MFFGIGITLAVYIFIAVPLINSYAMQNYLMTYTAFILIYTFMILRYVVGINPLQSRDDFLGWVLIFLATDIFLFPLLITPEKVVANIPPETMMSSDIFIYSLIPSTFPHFTRYIITYIIIPTIFLYFARRLMGRSQFHNALRKAV